MTNLIQSLQDLYRDLPFNELEEAFQIAQANLVEVKQRERAGLALPGELRDATADFRAVRGLIVQLSQQGAA